MSPTNAQMAKPTKLPNNSSAQGDFPADWPLSDFPNPNPYFPPPPRRQGMWQWWVLLATLLGIAGAITGVFAAPAHRADLTIGCVVIGVLMTVFALRLTKSALAVRVWKNASIFPARVIRAPEEGEDSDVVSLSFTGILAELFFTFIYRPGEVSAKLECVRGGERKVVGMKAWGQDFRLLEGDIIWVIPHGPPGRVVSLDRVAPDEYFGLRVPAEVTKWLENSLAALAPDDPGVVEDLDQAARENTQAFRRAVRYEKRPG